MTASGIGWPRPSPCPGPGSRAVPPLLLVVLHGRAWHLARRRTRSARSNSPTLPSRRWPRRTRHARRGSESKPAQPGAITTWCSATRTATRAQRTRSTGDSNPGPSARHASLGSLGLSGGVERRASCQGSYPSDRVVSTRWLPSLAPAVTNRRTSWFVRAGRGMLSGRGLMLAQRPASIIGFQRAEPGSG
jgi:hypothetical protein